LGLVVASLQTRRRFPLNRRGEALVLWGAWLLTQAIFFSVAGFFHTYYMVMLAPSIAALAGIGLVALWQDFRRAGRRGWLLPLALVETAAIQAYLLSPYPEWSRWLTPLVVGICVVAAGLLALARLGARLSLPALRGAIIAGMLALLAAPAAWAVDTVGGGSGLTPSAGPAPQTGRPNGFAPQTGRPNGFARYFGAGRTGGGEQRGGGEQNTVDTRLVRYLQANQGATRYLFATLNATSAAPFILATGKPVMALGGFSGSDRIVTPDQLARLVSNRTVRFFLLPSTQTFNPENLPPQVRGFFRRGGGPRGGFGGSGLNGDLTQWVSAHCTAVPATRWQTPSTQPGGAPGFGFGGFGRGGGQQLYDCAGHATAHAPSHKGSTAALDQGSLAMSLVAPASGAIS
jgi:4-amino-4-deoxy-L-arabinose transferase-like glycosyltransferase